MCRFFWTGPAWRFGLCSKFNYLTTQLVKENKPFPKIEADFERLNHEYTRAVLAGTPFYQHRELEKAKTAYESTKARIDHVGHSWQATYIYIQMVQEIAKRPECRDQDSGLTLVSMGTAEDFDFALEKCHHSDLLANVLARGTLFPAASQPNEANIDLCRMLDRMLFNNGIPGILVTLEEEEAAATALEIYKFLRLRIRDEDLYRGVLDCGTTLEALGFKFQLEEMLRMLKPFQLVPFPKRDVVSDANLPVDCLKGRILPIKDDQNETKKLKGS